MKSTIKIITILGIVISFFPAYPMKKSTLHTLETNSLKNVDPFSQMKNLIVLNDFSNKIPRNDQFFTQKNLAVKLSTIKYFYEPNNKKSKQILKTICDAVGEGRSVTSKHRILPAMKKGSFHIISSQSSLSIFVLIKDWFDDKWFTDEGKKNGLLCAIFQGERNRKERLAYVHNELETHMHDNFKLQIPKDLIFMLLEFLPENNVSEEETALIEEAEQMKKLEPILFTIDTCIKKIMKERTNNE